MIQQEEKSGVVGNSDQELEFLLSQGDGIGPEITAAVGQILDAAGVRMRAIPVEMGEKSYLAGHTSGISPEAWELLRHHRLLLKAPITTPRGGGYKSLNVTLRKAFGLFANVRPVKSFPTILGGKPMDVVIVRENEEDTYAGIEHRQTHEVTQCLKLITTPGTDRILHYAFRLAEARQRRELTLMVKDNIMKITDGVFSSRFESLKADFPSVKTRSMIIDIGTAKLAVRPQDFDVVVAPNLYGDILSDVAAEVSGSVGLAGSANLGVTLAMFEAVHGSAPDIAGKGVANPSGLLQAALMMLAYAGRREAATLIENAWLCALEDGYRTADIASGKEKEIVVGTDAFARAVIERLGRRPKELAEAHAVELPSVEPSLQYAALKAAESKTNTSKELHGIDIFLHWDEAGRDPNVLGEKLMQLAQGRLALRMISNRGVKVFPHGNSATVVADHWRCRFVADNAVTHAEILELMGHLVKAGFDIIKTENLYWFNGKPGYSLGQGE
ncbi:MAG: NADP-dependent isocitrate dehydrogenase [Turneriella sp.]|nr:NADP-dependent isocitrate dehydrogenase [Turneriella sp.]